MNHTEYELGLMNMKLAHESLVVLQDHKITLNSIRQVLAIDPSSKRAKFYENQIEKAMDKVREILAHKSYLLN